MWYCMPLFVLFDSVPRFLVLMEKLFVPMNEA